MQDQAAATPTNPALNYVAFNQPGPSKLWLVPGLVGLTVVVICMIIGAAKLDNGGSILVFFGGFWLMVASFGLYAWLQYKSQKAAFTQFVFDNGWQPIFDASVNCVATSLLDVGRSQSIPQAFGGSYHGLAFTAAKYQYITGSGKSQRTHDFINLAFGLQQEFPLIVLDDKQNNFLMFSDLPTRIPNGHELQLEGDFGHRWRTTVLPGTEQEVLQVLTPDFMNDLMNQTSKADIELEASRLFIIKEAGAFNKAGLQELFTMADVMIKDLGQLAATWQASSSAETVDNLAATALTPRAKLILRPRHVSIVSLIIFALYLVFVLLINRH